ncbi:MAG: prenyltransferase/squalene oxidase repeat-containing protein [Chthoniobacteraceae bacterium]
MRRRAASLIGWATMLALAGGPGIVPSLLAQTSDFQVYRGTQVAPEVERIYEKGLKYLVAAQNADGSLPGQYGTEPGVVGMALMAFLAHGDDPNHGPQKKAIARCIDYIIKQSNEETGYIGSSMYNHGFATLALAEAYGAVHDDRIAPALKKAVALILTSQEKNRFKAWRYSPDAQDADSTVSGACFVALIAARNAGLKVPDTAIADALKFYADCQNPGDGGIGYMPRSGSHGGATTAIGVAAFAYARKKDVVTFIKALKAMKGNEDGNGGGYPFYYDYYAAQGFFQGDFQAWVGWNDRQVKRLSELQNDDGSWDAGLGPGTCTALALLSIALNYRYLPIYER